MTSPPLDALEFTRRYLNLADPRLGAEAVSASDDFFAPKERMLNPEPAIFMPDKYDEILPCDHP
jgi:allantoicase